MQERLPEQGLEILKAVADAEGNAYDLYPHMTEIGERIGVSKQRVQQIAHVLIERGYLWRTDDTTRYLRLTRKGRLALEETT